jgi:hypothetical protein
VGVNLASFGSTATAKFLMGLSSISEVNVVYKFHFQF